MTGMGMTYNTEVYLTDNTQGFRSEKWYNANIEWNGSGSVKKILDEILKKNKGKVKGETAPIYSKSKFDKIMKEIKAGAKDAKADGLDLSDDSIAFEIAQNFLDEYKGLEQYLDNQGISDAQGWLANQI